MYVVPFNVLGAKCKKISKAGASFPKDLCISGMLTSQLSSYSVSCQLVTSYFNSLSLKPKFSFFCFHEQLANPTQLIFQLKIWETRVREKQPSQAMLFQMKTIKIILVLQRKRLQENREVLESWSQDERQRRVFRRGVGICQNECGPSSGGATQGPK